jgi:hypothetical protein
MFKLPLTLKVRRITRTDQHVEVEAFVVDADGVSVQAFPLNTGRRNAAEVAGILQSSVDSLAKSLHRRGKASLGEATTDAETEADFEALKQRQFIGSVST